MPGMPLGEELPVALEPDAEATSAETFSTFRAHRASPRGGVAGRPRRARLCGIRNARTGQRHERHHRSRQINVEARSEWPLVGTTLDGVLRKYIQEIGEKFWTRKGA
jgi:hypothetical protein